ncbi:hypothetical protein EON64_08355 [archaeon]|nr:MAG: hypothetical protein EON64_08355 [archaeon]
MSRNQITRSSSDRDMMALTASRESAAATRQNTATCTTTANTAVHTAASTARPTTHSMTHTSQPSTANQMNARAVSLAHDAILNIDLKVVNLKDIFRRKDPIEERFEGAVKIQTLIRGFLVRLDKWKNNST